MGRIRYRIVGITGSTGLGNETGKFENIKKKSTHEFFYLFIGCK